jgi:hypothetical protein
MDTSTWQLGDYIDAEREVVVHGVVHVHDFQRLQP